jgi:DNA-directed RNA polymerase specialized sigma24 family protein
VAPRDLKFSTLFRNHYPRVFAFLYGATLDIERARELSLVVFLRALAGPDLGEKPLQLFEIARQVAAERHTSRRPTASRDDSLDAGSRDLIGALSTLSASDREVLSLHFDAGLSDADISAVIHAREDEVRLMLSRAIADVRSALLAERAEPQSTSGVGHAN